MPEENTSLKPSELAGKAPLRWWWMGLVLLCLLGGGAYLLLAKLGDAQPLAHKRGSDSPDKPLPVAVATARQSDVDVYLAGLGTVTPLNTVIVKSRVDG